MNIFVIIKVVLAAVLLVLAIIDLKKKQIPVVVVLAVTGVLLLIGIPLQYVHLLNVTAGILSGMILIVIAKVTKEAIGIGDGFVFVMLGAGLGVISSLLILFYALLLASIVSGVLLVIKRVSKKSRMPFIPFVFLSYLGVTLI